MERDSGVKEFIHGKEKNVAKSGYKAIRCTLTTIHHITTPCKIAVY